MDELILIIDLGTTNIKATAFNLHGKAVYNSVEPAPVTYDEDSMEIDPETLWRAVKKVCGNVLAQTGNCPIRAISISSMAASFIPLDAEGVPLYPAIGWADGRAVPYMQKEMSRFLSGDRIKNCGQYPLPMYAPFKIDWFTAAHPEMAVKIRKWLNVSEFIYSRLIGSSEYYTDYSIASRTMLFDVEKRSWNPYSLTRFNIDEDWLPIPVEAGTVIGTTGKEMAGLGLSTNTPVVMGGHDHMCAILGAGIDSPDVLLNSTGTSEAIISLINPPYDSGKIVGAWLNCECTIQQGKVAVTAYVSASGRIYQSACESFLPYDNILPDEIINSPVFLPPQRAQLPSVKGRIEGISPVFNSRQLHRALRDGMYLECRRVTQRIMNILGGETATVLRCVGGHTKNLPEMKLKSSAMGLPIELIQQTDISSKGAAVLAGVSIGLFDSIAEAIDVICCTNNVYIVPDKALMCRYTEIYENNYLPCFPDGIYEL